MHSSPPPSFAKPANEPGLHHLGQQRVAQQHDGQIQPEQRRERDESKRVRQRRYRQPGAGRYDNYGSEAERPTGPALDERDFVGANDMDDECLGEERLHKPAGVEQGRVVPAVENVQHQEKRQVIEDGADRPDKQNKSQDLPNLPLARFGQPVGIHLVGGNGGLREVVQEVVGQHLDRQHGEEGQERAGPHDAEHVAEVRAGRHFDVFDNVAEHAPAFQHALLQHQQAVFQEDDVGGFLGDVHGAVDRDAHIGGFQGRSVVDAVAHESQYVALALERADDAFFVRGGQPGKDAGGAGGFGQLRVVHRLDLGAEQDVLYRHAHLLADVGGDDLVVAGEDFDVHAQAV